MTGNFTPPQILNPNSVLDTLMLYHDILIFSFAPPCRRIGQVAAALLLSGLQLRRVAACQLCAGLRVRRSAGYVHLSCTAHLYILCNTSKVLSVSVAGRIGDGDRVDTGAGAAVSTSGRGHDGPTPLKLIYINVIIIIICIIIIN